jgi:mannose-1-phosphate guanylyltransferase/mannose-6-phosphate isomerase
VSEHYAVILCGGSVTRLWPLSRTLRATQLLALNGDKTLLQQTAVRLTNYVIPAHLFTVTHEDHKCEVKRRQTKPFKDLRGLRIESTRVFA